MQVLYIFFTFFSVLGFVLGGVSQKLSGKWGIDVKESYSKRLRMELRVVGCQGVEFIFYLGGGFFSEFYGRSGRGFGGCLGFLLFFGVIFLELKVRRVFDKCLIGKFSGIGVVLGNGDLRKIDFVLGILVIAQGLDVFLLRGVLGKVFWVCIFGLRR